MADNLVFDRSNNISTVDRSGVHTYEVEPLGVPGVSTQVTAGSASTNTALTTTCRRISIHCRTAAARYVVGSTSQTAVATSHYIARDERIDISLPNATPNIAFIRADSLDAAIEITEYL